MPKLIFLFILLHLQLQAAVKSNSGTIKFDADSNQTEEMRLDSTGLGIGVVPSTNLHVQGNAIISHQVNIGGSTSTSSNLHISGTIGTSVQTISSNTTLSDTSTVLVDTSSDNITLTLPYAGNVSGRIYTIKKVSTENIVTINGGGNFIDSGNIAYLDESNDMPYVKVISNGEQWYSISAHSTGFVETPSQGNLLLWYKFDEESGTTATDSSNYNNNGTLNNISFSGNRVNGILGGALSFDGTDDYVEASTNVNYFGNSFTMSLWFKTNDSGDSKLVSTGGGVHPLQVFSGTLRTCTGGCSVGAISIDDNEWHFAAVVGNGTDIRVFLDGVSTPEITRGGTSSDLTGVTRIGIVSDGLGFDYEGAIDDVRIYDMPLSVDQILNIYNEAN